jgi:hypothetical protein
MRAEGEKHRETEGEGETWRERSETHEREPVEPRGDRRSDLLGSWWATFVTFSEPEESWDREKFGGDPTDPCETRSTRTWFPVIWNTNTGDCGDFWRNFGKPLSFKLESFKIVILCDDRLDDFGYSRFDDLFVVLGGSGWCSMYMFRLWVVIGRVLCCGFGRMWVVLFELDLMM